VTRLPDFWKSRRRRPQRTRHCRTRVRFFIKVPDQGKAGQSRMTEVGMRLGSLLLVVWLIIGGLAAGQRGDYKRFIGGCSRAGTIAVTILAGPLNYVGVNPDINCTAPRPSS
jgi:hypothetical protein